LKNRQITIIDVAKSAGVSIATVSNVLNRRNVPLSHETIRKVEDAAQALGYRRNVMAASLSRKKTFELGLILPSFGGYFADFAHVMQDAVHRCGYHLSVYSSYNNPELEKRHLETLLQRRVDGLFCHGLAMPPELARKFVGEGTPMVLFNAWNWPEDVTLGAVNLDFAGGAAEAVEHLAAQGCQALVYISKQRARATDHQRQLGFLKGIGGLAAGACKHHEIIPSVTLGEEGLYQTLVEHVQKYGSVGLLAFDDYDALIMLSRLRERGVKVPEQIKIVGINDQMFVSYCWPPITSLAIDLENQVFHAVHLLLSHLGEAAALEAIPLQGHKAVRPEEGPAHEIHIPMKLMRRMSTDASPCIGG
jgi:LacI family transcriptional regulator